MSGVTRSMLRTPRVGKQYPLHQQVSNTPDIPDSFRYDRGGAMRVPGATSRVTDGPGEKSSFAWPSNPNGLMAFREHIEDGSYYSNSRHWRTWPQTQPFVPTPFEQPK